MAFGLVWDVRDVLSHRCDFVLQEKDFLAALCSPVITLSTNLAVRMFMRIYDTT